MDIQELRKLRPALRRYVAKFDGCIKTKKSRQHMRTYLAGQLGPLERKSVEPIALEAGVPPRTLQEFLAIHRWDDEAVVENPLSLHKRGQAGGRRPETRGGREWQYAVLGGRCATQHSLPSPRRGLHEIRAIALSPSAPNKANLCHFSAGIGLSGADQPQFKGLVVITHYPIQDTQSPSRKGSVQCHHSCKAKPILPERREW